MPREILEEYQKKTSKDRVVGVSQGLDQAAVNQGTKTPFTTQSPAPPSKDNDNQSQTRVTPSVASRPTTETPVAPTVHVVVAGCS